jgi:hypothetical protein
LAGLSKEQDLAGLNIYPVKLPQPNLSNPPAGLFLVSVGGKPLSLYASGNGDTHLAESITVPAGTTIEISLIPLNKGKTTGIFNKQKISFTSTKNSQLVSTSITVPLTTGTYLLTTAGSPIPLAIQVTPSKSGQNTSSTNSTSSSGFWTTIKNFFKKVF